MSILIECGIYFVVFLIGLAILSLGLKMVLGRNLTYKLFVWLIPAVLAHSAGGYVLGMLGGMCNLSASLVMSPIVMTIFLRPVTQ